MLNQIATDYHDEEDPDAQRWAQEHRRFLEENRPDVLLELQKSGSLDSYLSSVGNTASEMLSHAMLQLLNNKELQKLRTRSG